MADSLIVVPDPVPSSDASPPELVRALALRDRLRTRMTRWERWRSRLVVPLIVVGGAVGYALGAGLHALTAMPDRTEAFVAVVGVVVMGRVTSSYFDIRKLTAAQVRVETLTRAARSRRSGSE